MRNLHLLCRTVLFAALLPAVLVRAQFQPPTPDELKMTSDPKAPGAPAAFGRVAVAPNLDAQPEHSPVTGLPFATVGLR